MTKWFRSRNNLILLGIMICMVALAGQLFSLTIVQGDSWGERAESLSIRTITTSAPRGQILDRYGRLLAGNTPSFTVLFTAGNLTAAQLNDQALRLMNIFEQNGDSPIDNVPIVIAEDGSMYYTHDQIIAEWLTGMEMPVDYTAEDVYAELKRRYSIDEDVSNVEAQLELMTMHNVSPPISVTHMKFTETQSKEYFLGLHFGKDSYGLTAAEAFEGLRKKYKIEETVSDVDARKIMVVRHQISALGYLQYNPAKIAKGVSAETVVEIEERSTDLIGVEIQTDSVRYYPNESAAAHILGYIGVVSDSEIKNKAELGVSYGMEDMIGKTGIEAAYEDALRGENGSRSVEVNAYGQQTRVLSEVKAKKGNDVYLTIDLELQKVAEDALERALAALRVNGTFHSEWGNYPYNDKPLKKNAYTGAVVAMDVKTGEVLAMASYPSYDPNLFATGISTENWQILQGENQRDSLAPLPLVNIATRTAVQPGSIFKMVTATAAIESGWNPNNRLYDNGYIMIGSRSFGCWYWNENGARHGSLNLYEAIERSCNYYFYDLVADTDHYRGGKLGMDDMGIEKILQYAVAYGLDGATGIEITESAPNVPTIGGKRSGIRAMLRSALYRKAHVYFEDYVLENEDNLTDSIRTIASWIEIDGISYAAVVAKLDSVGVKEDMKASLARTIYFDYFLQADWQDGDSLNMTIGQGLNAYTPLQLTRYISTIANGGVRHEASVVRAVEGQGVLERAEGVPLTLNYADTISHIQRAMEQTGRPGTKSGLDRAFRGFPVRVAAKTGTAQKSGRIQPPDEVEYMKQYLHRFDRNLAWETVETEMYRLMETYPSIYTNTNSAVRQAVINMSANNLDFDDLDIYKEAYHNFSWFVCYAPADEPEIAITVLLVQGGSGANGAPVAREIIGAYMDLDHTYEDYELDTATTH